MDKTLTADLADRMKRYLDALENGVKTGAEFVADQSPAVYREVLNWEIAKNAIPAFALLLAILLVWAMCIKGKVSCRKQSTARQPGESEVRYENRITTTRDFFYLCTVAPYVATLLLGIPVVAFTVLATKPIVAPRIVVIQTINHALR